MGTRISDLAAWGMLITACVACSGQPQQEDVGNLMLPLATHGPSGAEYRLRSATFDINPGYYSYGSGGAYGSSAGIGNTPATVSVSSEADPDANSISVELEQGAYNVALRPGWQMEKVEGGVGTPVEATLLTSGTVIAYVYPHSSAWVDYSFGIGGRAVWLNGQLDINIGVYEDPNQYYGGAGYGGLGPSGGSPGVAGAGGAISSAGAVGLAGGSTGGASF